MEYEGLKFYTIKPTKGPGLRAGKVGENSKLGGAIQLVQMGMLSIMEYGVKMKIKKQLKDLSEKIKKAKGD